MSRIQVLLPSSASATVHALVSLATRNHRPELRRQALDTLPVKSRRVGPEEGIQVVPDYAMSACLEESRSSCIILHW
jgi:hypothetical protein